MQTKKIRLSFLILTGLILLSYGFLSYAEENSPTSNNIFLDSDQDGLSDEEEKTYGTDPKNSDTDNDGYSDGAEVKSGYDPKKPAPGDKIITETALETTPPLEDKGNLTKEVAQKISTITNSTNPEDKEMTLEEIESLVSDSLTEVSAAGELPSIDEDEIKIKKQNYANLSATEIETAKKEDFIKYSSAMFYILASNSPKPITSYDDLSSAISYFSEEIILAISEGDASEIEKLSKNGEQMLEQLQTIEVPEELVDMHIQGLRFAKYAVSLQDFADYKDSDPLFYLANLSRIKSLTEALANFSDEINSNLAKYEINFDDSMKDSFEKLGISNSNTDDIE